jgi:hypothetical protein
VIPLMRSAGREPCRRLEQPPRQHHFPAILSNGGCIRVPVDTPDVFDSTLETAVPPRSGPIDMIHVTEYLAMLDQPWPDELFEGVAGLLNNNEFSALEHRGRYNDDMQPSSSDDGALRTTLDLFETGVELMRETLRRRYAGATEAELDDRLRQWLHHRPGAEFGDCQGRPIDVHTRFG